MKLSISLCCFLLLGCSDKQTEINESCMDILESDTFYFALPLDEGAYKAMYRLENYLTQGTNSQALTIDFDCAIVVNPTNEQVNTLRETLGPDFEENVNINTRHSDAISCFIESKGIRTLGTTKQFVRFIGENRAWNLDIRKDTLPDWKIILFKKEKEPLILPNIAVTIEEVTQYFQE